MQKAGKNRLSKDRRERQRRYREHHHTATHFVRLRLPQPRVIIDADKRWYGVRTLAYLQRRLQSKLAEAEFVTWLPSMAIAGGQYLPISGTVMVGLDDDTTPLWRWHDHEVDKGMTRPFYALLGPVAGADLQHFSDWLTGYGAGHAMPVFRLGDNVMILDGPFANVAGVVEETDPEHCRLKASVDLFGRRTNVVLPFAQVERLAA